ncbi:MAG: hypothetical protein M1140_06615 [Chloroflexi bacterium]|nr:hypothetical protein [Chloroflexota bacterium]
MPRNKPFNIDELAQSLIESDPGLGEIDMQALAAQLPPGLDPQRLLDAIGEFGNCAIFLDEELIGVMCSVRAFEKGRKLFSAGQIVLKSFDGKTIRGIVADGNRRYEPEVEFKLNSYGCNCTEPGIEGCSHIAALMLAWVQDYTAFLPSHPSQEDVALLGRGPYGKFLMAITGEKNFTRALERISEIQAQPGGQTVPGHLLPDKAQSNISTGAAFWPTASSIRMNPPALKQTIEAEFNTAQLRELAKWLGIKLKGNAKSAYVEQVTAELGARVARLRETPEALVAGLTDDQAAFVRRALTARDYYLPLPRNLANALWSQLVNRDPDKRLVDMLDALRRRAVLFPTHIYVGYRDVYYQWLPLEASGGNVPLMTWPRGPITTRGQAHRPAVADTPHFLDAFDLLINAVMSTGAEVRPRLPPHAKAGNTAWLKDWEHQSEEADRLLNSRPGWVPNPQSGISVPLLSPLTSEALTRLQNQTGLSGAHIEFLFEIAATLQLIEAPDSLASARNGASAKRMQTAWRVNARASAVEEWFARSGAGTLPIRARLAGADGFRVRNPARRRRLRRRQDGKLPGFTGHRRAGIKPCWSGRRVVLAAALCGARVARAARRSMDRLAGIAQTAFRVLPRLRLDHVQPGHLVVQRAGQSRQAGYQQTRRLETHDRRHHRDAVDRTAALVRRHRNRRAGRARIGSVPADGVARMAGPRAGAARQRRTGQPALSARRRCSAPAPGRSSRMARRRAMAAAAGA